MCEVNKSVAKAVSCISCRAAADRLLKQIQQTVESTASEYSLALDPVRIDRFGRVSIRPSLLEPESLYTLLYIDRFDF